MNNLPAFLTSLLGAAQNNVERDIMPTSAIAKTVLAAILLTKYKDQICQSSDYTAYNGSALPTPSGYSSFNALSTYIDHGGDKTEAIEKFIDKNLRTPVQIEALLKGTVCPLEPLQIGDKVSPRTPPK